ncbi:MAG: S-methyl-5-thioribose-1-phosphate isomerase [Synechococcales cyanobacterium CRU_2_2]|nr:S-methyl-5-thioribose-1-phosphate isomerase [Synechococcales cyanobacterium CRU_2_2]
MVPHNPRYLKRFEPGSQSFSAFFSGVRILIFTELVLNAKLPAHRLFFRYFSQIFCPPLLDSFIVLLDSSSTHKLSEVSHVYPILWQEDHVLLVDQTRLPREYGLVEIRRSADMAEAIQRMIVRGAPAIGVAAAYGMYLGAKEIKTRDRRLFLQELEAIAARLRATRPTAVNLFWAIDRMVKLAHSTPVAVEEIVGILLQEAQSIHLADLQTCYRIGEQGLTVLPESPQKLRILTHCNTGALATAGYGTALGVVRSAWRENRLERVYADETRPRLQGAKLTAWECIQEGIPVTLITDSMAAQCMKEGRVDVVIVGADRIAANGDTANKIGTYSLALVSKAHQIPFYVAAPLSTVDFALPDGSGIPIEERDPREIAEMGDTLICPAGTEFYNPAFDVTPAELIAGIITEVGVVKPEELRSLQA